MKYRIVWPRSVRLVLEALPERDQDAIVEKMELLAYFPLMYAVRSFGRHFRRHRCFQAGDWLVFYRFVDKTVYIRGLWPARIP